MRATIVHRPFSGADPVQTAVPDAPSLPTRPANGHSRTAIKNGRIVGGRGLRLMSKIGQQAISLGRLEILLKQDQQRKQA